LRIGRLGETSQPRQGQAVMMLERRLRGIENGRLTGSNLGFGVAAEHA
jgi:hypothetical protein